jgi:hypothetical protein
VLGNGDSDFVSMVAAASAGSQASIDGNHIVLGNGNGDHVSADSTLHGAIQNNIITLGDGAGDSVDLSGGAGVDLSGSTMSGNVVTLGGGDGDSVNISAGGAGHNRITLGDGNADTVTDLGLGNTIILGNGNGDHVNEAVGGPFATAGAATIMMGDGRGDLVTGSSFSVIDIQLGNGDNDSIGTGSPGGAYSALAGSVLVLGDGNNDQVYFIGAAVVIKLGDGNNDFVRDTSLLGGSISVGNGNGDTIDISVSNGILVTVGNGNDTIHAGKDSVITLGKGSDLVTYDWTTSGSGGQAGSITGFNTSKDVIQLHGVSNVTIADNSGNATISDGLGDTVTLIGVHAADLHVGAAGNVQLI